MCVCIYMYIFFSATRSKLVNSLYFFCIIGCTLNMTDLRNYFRRIIRCLRDSFMVLGYSASVA